MILCAYEHTKRRLTVAEKNAYLAEQAVIGRMGGADRIPTTVGELDDYVSAMRPKLSVNAQTREFIDFLMTTPFTPFGVSLPASVDREVHRFAIYAGMSRAPRWAGELIGYDRPPWLTSRAHRTAAGARRAAPAMGVRHPAVRRAGPGAGRIRCCGEAALMAGGLVALLRSATDEDPPDAADRTAERILDAAVLEAAHVGLQRITVEDVVRRAAVSRMTAYRRYPRRDDLVAALVRRETRRFLAAVATGIDAAQNPREGVAAAFIAAVQFSRAHPMLRRAGQTDSALPADDMTELLAAGSAFIAEHVGSAVPGYSSADTKSAVVQQVRWVSDVFARLFLTYISWPPSEPDFDEDAELVRFAHEILTPMVDRLAGARS